MRDAVDLTKDLPPVQEFVDELMAAADRRLRASRGRLRREASDEADLAVRVGCSVAAVLDAHIHEFASHHGAYGRWFEEQWSEQLKTAVDHIDLMLALGQHLSSKVMDATEVSGRTARTISLIELHSHSLLVSSEIADLVRSGWPAAAEARWRTLHEIEVFALTLARAPQSVCNRYLASLDTDMNKLLEDGSLRLPEGPDGDAVRAEYSRRAELAFKRHGPELAKPNGWALRWLRKKRVTFRDLEERVVTRRPAYVSASNRVHAGRVGTVFSIVDSPGNLLTGRRSDGTADVALKMLWSANTVAAALLADARAETGDDAFAIWDEAQTELAGEADVQVRRAETTRLLHSGRSREAAAYRSSPEAAFVRTVRDVGAPRTGRFS